MLLSLTGKMPEALLAMSNAVDLAKSKPTDDPLALARAYDAIGRTLIEMNETQAGISSLQKALGEFSKTLPQGSSEITEIKSIIDQASTGS